VRWIPGKQKPMKLIQPAGERNILFEVVAAISSYDNKSMFKNKANALCET
jgi:hypothetical protein